jgi:predicted outer membrane protein
MNNRRVVLAGLAAAAALPAAAQQVQQNQAIPSPVTPQATETQPSQGLGANAQQREQRTTQGGAPQDTRTPERQGGAQAGAQGGSPTSQPGQQQSQADAQYIQQTLAAGTVSLQQSNFAHTKAENPRVKQFAEFEIGEQNILADVLHSQSDPSTTASTASTGAAAAASTAPVLSDRDAQIMERFSRAQPGAAFDKDYVTAQIQGHRNLLAIQERYIQSGSQSRELVNVARLARGQIQEHLAKLETLQQEVGR